MKISTILQRPRQSLSSAATEAAIATLVEYAKMHRLLHGQLWAKDRLKATGVAGVDFTVLNAQGEDVSTIFPLNDIPTRVVTVDYEFTFDGKQVKPIKFWNIKTPSVNPYSEKDLVGLGLNQLFVGQSAYAKYQGNPGDDSGIYHDTCIIHPKGTDLSTYDNMGWYIKGHGQWASKTFFGEDLYTDVYTYEKFETVVHPEIPDDPGTPANEYVAAWEEQVSLGWFYVVVTPTGSTEYVLNEVEGVDDYMNPIMYYPSVEYINLSILYGHRQTTLVPPYTVMPDLSGHGSIMYETSDIAYVAPIDVATLYIWYDPEVITRVYSDGTAVQVISSMVWRDNSYEYFTPTNGKLVYLPLVDINSGELIQNRVDFIEGWDSSFELYVHEDGYWYDGVINIIIIIVAAVISYISCGALAKEAFTVAMGVIAAFGGAIAAIGAITGNKVFQILGAVFAIYSIFAQGVAQAASQGAMQQGLSQRTASQIAQEAVTDMTVASAVQGLASFGMGNIMSLVMELNSILTTIMSSEVATLLPTDESQAEDGAKLMMIGEEDDYVARVMKIGDLPRLSIA